MDKSKVFFTNLHTTPSSNLLDKMERLIKRAGIESIDFKDQFVAIKIHFGEPGNLAYLRPNYAARLATLLLSITIFIRKETGQTTFTVHFDLGR